MSVSLVIYPRRGEYHPVPHLPTWQGRKHDLWFLYSSNSNLSLIDVICIQLQGKQLSREGYSLEESDDGLDAWPSAQM